MEKHMYKKKENDKDKTTKSHHPRDGSLSASNSARALNTFLDYQRKHFQEQLGPKPSKYVKD